MCSKLRFIKIECPHCREKTYSLRGKFVATVSNIGVCSNCGKKSARPTLLSIISIIIVLSIREIDRSMLLLTAYMAFFTILFEFIAFSLEPISEQRIKNRNKYILISIVLVIVLGMYYFKWIFLTYSPGMY
jgi:hypothetical protein